MNFKILIALILATTQAIKTNGKCFALAPKDIQPSDMLGVWYPTFVERECPAGMDMSGLQCVRSTVSTLSEEAEALQQQFLQPEKGTGLVVKHMMIG